MNLGTENRKKTITAASLGMVAVICLGYLLFQLFGGDSAPTPPPAVAPVAAPAAPVAAAAPTTVGNAAGAKTLVLPTGNAAGVPANKVGSASASLDPTLDEAAMLRTERLVYSGSGRNIFSAAYTPPPAAIPAAAAPARPVQQVIQQPVIQQQPTTCPPTCPPIPLKFFGTETLANGTRQAFLLQGDDVFLAAAGDIVARRFRIVAVNTNSVQVEDMGNKNTQTLPLQSN